MRSGASLPFLVAVVGGAVGCGGTTNATADARGPGAAGAAGADAGAAQTHEMDAAVGAADGPAGAGGGTDAVPAADGGGTASGVTYQAEDAFLVGALGVAATPAGFSGTGVVGGWSAAGDAVVFTVNVERAGAVTCGLLYRNPGAAAAPLAVWLNGARFGASTLAPGDAYGRHDDALPLRAGLNTIAYVSEASVPSGFALDALVVGTSARLAPRGATVPFVTYEAEAGRTNGATIGPDRTYGTVAAEASQRRAVRLEAAGAYVEQTTTAAANALVVRFSMPDAPAGGGTSGALGVYVDGQKRATLPVGSRYAWVYGGYPYGNDPDQGAPHRYFDEARALIGDVPAGAVVRLQKETGDAVPYYVVDLFELEQAPPAYAPPAGAISIEAHGATSGDASDDTAALRAAIAAAKAQHQDVWIPAGDYTLTARVDVGGVTIRGAGPWHSVLHGSNGKGGFNGTGGAVKLLDFALFGDVTHRDDAAFDAGVDGTLGAGSLIQNVWFEHTKVGVWVIGGDTTLVVGCRIRDTFADGVNFTRGTRRSMVEQTTVRNTGDDGVALWSTGSPDANDVVRFSTVTAPLLANGIALYGGADNAVTDNLVADTVVAAAGIAISTRAEFSPSPFTGATRVLRNTLTRTGGYEPNWKTSFGGLWVFADASALPPGLLVGDVELVDSTHQGLLVSGNQRVEAARFERVAIRGAGASGIQIASPGSGTFTAVTVTGAGASTIAPAFAATKDAASSGW